MTTDLRDSFLVFRQVRGWHPSDMGEGPKESRLVDRAPDAPGLVVDEQGTPPWLWHYAQPTLHVQEGRVCWGTLPGGVVDTGFKPRLDPQPTLPGRGRGGLGGVLWPGCSAGGGGRQNGLPDSSTGEPGSGGLGTDWSPRPRPDPGFLCGSGTSLLSLGLFPVSHPDWVPRALGPDTV